MLHPVLFRDFTTGNNLNFPFVKHVFRQVNIATNHVIHNLCCQEKLSIRSEGKLWMVIWEIDLDCIMWAIHSINAANALFGYTHNAWYVEQDDRRRRRELDGEDERQPLPLGEVSWVAAAVDAAGEPVEQCPAGAGRASGLAVGLGAVLVAFFYAVG